MKNPQLKRAYSKDEYTPEMIRELKRCKEDPIYFMRNYVKINHPQKGVILFDMFDYQERFVKHIHENRFSMTLQPRQCGKTITVAMYLLWYACFTPDVTVLIASKSGEHAMEIAARIKLAYEELPNWLKPGLKYYNMHKIEMDNGKQGSRIICEATTEKTGRGLSISKLYLDELAFISLRIQQLMWNSLSPTLSTGGSAIISSTPNGDTELFATMWRGAMSGLNVYKPFTVHWREHPERGDQYWDDMIGQIGELATRQEVGCEFLSSDALLINSLKLQQVAASMVHHEDMGFKFWVPDEEIGGAGKTYLVGMDPATGTLKDFTVIEVFEFPSLKQVAEWRHNDINIPLMYAKLKWILNKLSEPQGRSRAEVLWTFERNGVGEAVAALYQNDEHQPEHAELFSDHVSKLGVFTSGRTKILACLKLKSLIEKVRGGLQINSEQLLFELKNFVAKGGSYEGKSGATDDAVMATVQVIRLIQRLAEYNEDAFKQVNQYVDPDSADGDEFGDEPIPFAIS